MVHQGTRRRLRRQVRTIAAVDAATFGVTCAAAFPAASRARGTRQADRHAAGRLQPQVDVDAREKTSLVDVAGGCVLHEASAFVSSVAPTLTFAPWIDVSELSVQTPESEPLT